MLISRFVISVLVCLATLTTAMVCAQEYPTKPIRVMTGGVGGTSDASARLIAQGLSAHMGQQAVVVNLSSGVVPGQTVSQAAPDGYTLLVAGGTFTIGPLLEKTPYDPVRDFLPITLVATAPNILIVHPSLPVKNVRELVALAKSRPGALNYASGPTGSPTHLAAELFKAMAGINVVRIPYRSGATQMADLIGGHVQMSFGNASSVKPYVKAGRLRALAVTSTQPSALAPGLPTVASNVPGYESVSMTGLFAPARTPDAIIRKLNQEGVRFLRSPEAREKCLNLGVDPGGNTPEEYAAKIKSEIDRLGKLIKNAGIKVE